MVMTVSDCLRLFERLKKQTKKSKFSISLQQIPAANI
jgi:hypothetical protein